MRKRTLDILFWLLAALAAALLGLFVLVLSGAITTETDGPDVPNSAPNRSVSETAPPTAAPPDPPAATTTTRRAAPELAEVTVRATRGDCWVETRLGSENGRTLAALLLPVGESVTFKARAVWLSLGASGNVDVTVNGRPRALPSGTVAVVLTRGSQT